MQMMHQIPILQPVADKTVGNPVSTTEESTIKAAILRHTLETRSWMLVKSTYLSILGVAILAWLQVTVVNIASFTTLRLQNIKRRGNTDIKFLKCPWRASKASTAGEVTSVNPGKATTLL